MNILIVDDEYAAIRDLEIVLKRVEPKAEVESADNADDALRLMRRNAFDVLFLDIRMPEKNGLNIASEAKELCPLINIIMVTAYPEYALDALKLYVSGYILKPVIEEEVREELLHLRHPLPGRERGLYVQCFGNFEVFYNGEVVRFSRLRAKEMLAYLIDRRGASVTNAELRAVLWEDDTIDQDRQRDSLAHIVSDLRSTLKRIGCEDIFKQERNSYSIIPERIRCDYYQAQGFTGETSGGGRAWSEAEAGEAGSGSETSGRSFTGEYMSQYSWAEYRLGELS